MKKYIFIIFFFTFLTKSFAEDKIYYIDINFLLNESEAGKYINSELKKINDKNVEEFKEIEISIKAEEEKILKQKNLLKEDEFNKKIKNLRNKYKSYQDLSSSKGNDLKELRNNAANQILIIINEILAEYSTKNKISLIIEKKNVVIGKSELDITKNILELLNAKIKKVELKNE
tara:strand:+ start:1504 stop:2025 length:522 start_codon:yes stop_codon:yes gene_type:complete